MVSVRIGPFLFFLCITLAVLICYLPEQTEAQPNIVVAITGFPSSLEPGDMIVYWIYFNNTGSDPSPAVWINLTMASFLVYQNDTSSMEGGNKTGDYNWTFTSVDIGSHFFRVEADLDSNISNMEVILSETHLDYKDMMNVSMPSSSDDHTALGVIPEIAPEALSDPAVVDPSDIVKVVIYFNNTGSAVADSVLINVTLPGEIGYLNDSSALVGGTKTGDYNWSFSSVAQGDHHFNITTIVAPGVEDGTLLGINATLRYSNAYGVWFRESGSNVTFTVVAPIVEIEKSANSSFSFPGGLVDYVIDVTNVGGGISKDVWINDTLPVNLSFADSFPNFESVVGNTYIFHFTDFASGTQQIFIQAEVNESAPVGQNLTNEVIAGFTDANGNPCGVDQAWANVSVVEVSMHLQMSLLFTQTTPKDVVVIEMRFQNEMIFPARFVWLNLTIPEHLSYLSDTSSAEGGIMTQIGSWVFTYVSVGNHSFEVTLLVDDLSRDGLTLALEASMVYTNQSGVVLGTSTDVGEVTVYRPEINIAIYPQNVTAKLEETFTLTAFFNNTGSRASQRVWMNATLPPGVVIVNDTSSEQGGIRDGANFTFSNVSTGFHSFQIMITIENDFAYTNFSFEFGYLDSDGDTLSVDSARISVRLLRDERFESPTVIIVGILTTASVAFASAFQLEQTFRFRFLSLIIPLYSRLRRKEILDNEIRGMIRGYVIANPGDHFTAIRKALDLKNGTLAYHLTVLEKEDIVMSIRDGKFRRFFPAGTKLAEAAYPSKIEESILEIIRQTPGISLKDIASLLGASSPTVMYHMKKLEKMNLVRKERHGISVRHYVEESP